jgi:hypothetical protein
MGKIYYLQDISGRETPQYPKKHKLCNMTELGLRIPFTNILKKHAEAILWKTKKSLFYWILCISSPANPMMYNIMLII